MGSYSHIVVIDFCIIVDFHTENSYHSTLLIVCVAVLIQH